MMKPITLLIQDINSLNSIQENFKNKKKLTAAEEAYFLSLLIQMPTSESFISEKISGVESIQVNAWNTKAIEELLKQWINLFDNIPGYDFAPGCNLLDDNSKELLGKNVIMTAAFAPTLSYNSVITNEAYEVHLQDSGSAYFWFPTFEDAKQYPELYNFKGTWKEAYLLLIETLKKGWPMEEFPDELKSFLKK